MGSIGGGGGLIHLGGTIRHLPIEGTLRQWESRTAKEAQGQTGEGKVEVAAIFDKDGNPIDAYLGGKHSVGVDPAKIQIDGATLTHLHPNDLFGGTFSMTDIGLMAKGKLGEIRAYSKQGQVYSLKAGPNADRDKLGKWVNSHSKLYQNNLNKSYTKALKEAVTPLKSGPNKGKVKLVDRRTGKAVYKAPLTPKQADAYARQVAVGALDRTYRKNLSKFGFTYTKTKGGK